MGKKIFKILILVPVIFFSVFGLVFVESNSILAQVPSANILPPVISVYPETLSNTEVFYIGGSAEPLSKVFIFIESGGREVVTAQAQVSENGDWFYVYPKFLTEGSYRLVVRAQNEQGVISPVSATVKFDVITQAIQVGGLRIRYETLYLAVMFILALLLLMFFVWAGLLMTRIRKKNLRLKKEIWEAEEAVRHGFRVLRDDLGKEVKELDRIERKRSLSAEEHERRNQLQKDLEFVAENIEKEVLDIEKQL
jgi:hypothetical protein